MGTFTFKRGQGDPVILTTDGETPPKSERKKAIERSKRNSLLADSDNKIVTDRGMSESKITEWKTYRQALRDVDFSDPDKITWPTKPE